MSKVVGVFLALLVIGFSVASSAKASAPTIFAKVYDGDTIELSTGQRVRLLQIDTPELSPVECYGKEAKAALVRLLNSARQISLKQDPKLDKVDRYGRLLRYVFIGKTNINLKMVEIGAAAPYFYRGDEGKYAAQILKAAKNAKAKSIGLWKSCPLTQLTPTRAVTTAAGFGTSTTSPSALGASCNPNYAGCIPVFPPDLDCTEIKRLGFAPVKVIGNDMHKLDRDGDGIGCNT